MLVAKTDYNTKIPSFGRIIRKAGNKPWPVEIEKAAMESPYLKSLAVGEKDVVLRLSRHIISKQESLNNSNWSQGDVLYKVYVSLVKNDFLSNLADRLRLKKRVSLTHNYHSEMGMVRSFNQAHFAKLFRRLKVQL